MQETLFEEVILILAGRQAIAVSSGTLKEVMKPTRVARSREQAHAAITPPSSIRTPMNMVRHW